MHWLPLVLPLLAAASASASAPSASASASAPSASASAPSASAPASADLESLRSVSFPYSEELNITPLSRNHVYTSFKFTLESEDTPLSQNRPLTHYKVFPRSLAPILQSTSTRELHLRFGQGWWDSEHWGQLPDAGESTGGVGVEIWAVIEAESSEASFTQWLALVNSLSGLFCASLNFIDSANTVFPLRSLTPHGDIPLLNSSNSLYLLRAALPAEPVCTENLTPFIKFLPTRGKAGLSSLLDGHRIFESEWHMMSIDIETHCSDESCKYTMQQKVDAVVDIARAQRRNKSPIPKPVSGDELICDENKPHDAFQCFALNVKDQMSFSLEDTFGRLVKGGNLISQEPSKICVHVPQDWEVYLQRDYYHYSTEDNCFELVEQSLYNVILKSENASIVNDIEEAPVLVSRAMTGYGQDKGGLRTVFTNNLDVPSSLIYLETLPWFMRVYLHSLVVTGARQDDVIKSIYYQPESDRKRPTHLEFEIQLPPRSTVAISYQFDKSMLLIAEYPPDANHGFSVEPGMVRVIYPVNYRARTSPALLTLATPDFSMPYNVIIFTATVMSLTFGTIFNLLFKRTLPEADADLIAAEFDIKVTIRAKIQGLKQRIASSFRGKDNKAVEGTEKAMETN